MPQTSNELRDKLMQVYAAKWAAENHPHYEEMLDRFAFHLADAAEDIQHMAGILKDPGLADPIACGKLLHRFFLHALPHLVAAGQLYDYVPDIFPEQQGVHTVPEAGSDETAEKPEPSKQAVISPASN